MNNSNDERGFLVWVPIVPLNRAVLWFTVGFVSGSLLTLFACMATMFSVFGV